MSMLTIDTLLNVTLFAYVGFLFWLVLQKN
jgi:hypothetical protein